MSEELMDAPQGVSAPAPADNAGQGTSAVVPDQNGEGTSAAAPVQTAPVDPNAERFAQIEKSYKELQGFSTKTAQERSELRKELAAIKDTLTKAFAKPHDPDAFMEELRAKGPDYLKELHKKQLDEVRQVEAQERQKLSEQVAETQSWNAILIRQADPENYPDFKKLMPEMSKAALDPASPIDKTLPPGQFLDALYQLVRLQHSQDALKAAEKHGRTSAEAALAKEAHTAVAGGGKTAGSAVPDFNKMTSAQMRELLVQHLGESDQV